MLSRTCVTSVRKRKLRSWAESNVEQRLQRRRSSKLHQPAVNDSPLPSAIAIAVASPAPAADEDAGGAESEYEKVKMKRKYARSYSVSARKSTVKSEMVRVLIKTTERTFAQRVSCACAHELGISVWNVVYPEDDEQCCKYCYENKATTVDHIFPMIQNSRPTGFGNDPYNLIPCCTWCNSSKSNSEVYSWLRRFYEKKQVASEVIDTRLEKVRAYVHLSARSQFIDSALLNTIYEKWSHLVDGIMFALDDMTKKTAVDINNWEQHLQQGMKHICDHAAQV